MLIVIIIIVALLSGCVSQDDPSSTSEEIDNASKDTEQKLRIAFITHVVEGGFFEKIKQGAEDASILCGVELTYIGTETIDLGQQLSLVDAVIADGYDGIVTSLWDEEGFTKLIEKAHLKGIPLLAFNVDSPDSGRDAYVGQNPEESGYHLGIEMFQRMGGKGKYMIACFAPGINAMQMRIAG